MLPENGGHQQPMICSSVTAAHGARVPRGIVRAE